MMTCKKFRELAYLMPEELEAKEFEELERHRAECSACAAEYVRIERARGIVRRVGHRQPALTDPLLLVNSVIGRIESEAEKEAPSSAQSLIERWTLRLSFPGMRMATACVLFLIAGSFALEYTRGYVEMKQFEERLDQRVLTQKEPLRAGIDQSALLGKAAEISRMLSGKQSTLELSENWVVMNKQSLEKFLVLYAGLKANLSELPPEFRRANPELMKVLETDRPGAEEMNALLKDREALVQELNRLVPKEGVTP